MSSDAGGEDQRTRQYLAKLEEAYRAGKIRRELYERLYRKYQGELGLSAQPIPGLSPSEDVSRYVGPAPRIVSIDGGGPLGTSRKKPKPMASIAVAVVAFLMILIMVLIAVSRR